jgi:hypothetical protein
VKHALSSEVDVNVEEDLEWPFVNNIEEEQLRFRIRQQDFIDASKQVKPSRIDQDYYDKLLSTYEDDKK